MTTIDRPREGIKHMVEWIINDRAVRISRKFLPNCFDVCGLKFNLFPNLMSVLIELTEYL